MKKSRSRSLVQFTGERGGMDWKCTLLTVLRYKLDQKNIDKKVLVNVTDVFHKD